MGLLGDTGYPLAPFVFQSADHTDLIATGAWQIGKLCRSGEVGHAAPNVRGPVARAGEHIAKSVARARAPGSSVSNSPKKTGLARIIQA